MKLLLTNAGSSKHIFVCYLLHADFFLGLDPEDRGDEFLRNIS
jgi:hypothetical protein